MNCRLELFFKSPAELLDQVPFLRRTLASRPHILGVNLTNKNKDDELIKSVKLLRQEIPDVDICVHYSLKYNYEGGAHQAKKKLMAFCQELDSVKGSSVLLVSGGGKKKTFNTVTALEKLFSAGPVIARDLPFLVAFNPYLPDTGLLEEEYCRLRSKLMMHPGRIRGIYLQMGTDIHALESGLDHLESILADVAAARSDAASGSDPQATIYGSVFIPSGKLLAQMRFRPWNGVYLSQEYLESVEGAESVTQKVLSVYSNRRVVPLIETAVRSDAELDRVETLLGFYGKATYAGR